MVQHLCTTLILASGDVGCWFSVLPAAWTYIFHCWVYPQQLLIGPAEVGGVLCPPDLEHDGDFFNDRFDALPPYQVKFVPMNYLAIVVNLTCNSRCIDNEVV